MNHLRGGGGGEGSSYTDLRPFAVLVLLGGARPVSTAQSADFFWVTKKTFQQRVRLFHFC